MSESVVGVGGQTSLVKYTDGEKKVVVSAEAQVVNCVPVDKTNLKVGAKLIAFVKPLPNGSFETSRIRPGRDDLTPPV
ncbi:hypothetical protein Q2941_28810 [Bradyrhizobium sp. UFLA05-153]